MKYKCINCGNRTLIEISHDKELHCSRVKCSSCQEEFLVWYNPDETVILLIEPCY